MSALAAAGGCGQAAKPPAQTAASPAPAAAPGAPPAVVLAAPVIGPPLVIVPAAEARSGLLVSVTIPSIDRTLASGTALVSRAVPLALDAASVKEMLLTQAGLPPKVGENLDTAAPSGAAVVAIGGSSDQPSHAGLVMAIPAKGSVEAGRVIAALGHVISKRSAALEIDNGTGGRGWVWQSANVLVISDSVEALSRGAMLALEARQAATSEDVTAVLHPEAIARANGTDLKSGLGLVVAGVRTDQAAKRAAGAAPDQLLSDSSLDLMDGLAAYLPDADSVEIGLALSGELGLRADVRLRPRAGTALEKLAQEAHPFEMDPMLRVSPGTSAAGVAGDLAFAGASSYGPFFREQLAKQRARLQASHDKGAAGAGKLFDAWLEAIAGPWSGVGRLKPSLSIQAVYPLKDAAAGVKLQAALARTDAAAALALWKTQVGPGQHQMFDWKVKRETVGKLKALHVTLGTNPKSLAPSVRDAVKNVLGESALDAYVAVAGTRLLTAVGKDAKAQLAALAGGKPTPAKSDAADDSFKELAAALAASKGKDSFGYFDAGRVVALVAPFLNDPRTALLSAAVQAPIPFYGTYATDGQGRVMTFALTLPPATFSGVGAILQGLGAAGIIK